MSFGFEIFSEQGRGRLIGFEPRNILEIHNVDPITSSSGSFTITKEFTGDLKWYIGGFKFTVDQDIVFKDEKVISITVSGNTIIWSTVTTHLTSGYYSRHCPLVFSAVVER